MNTLDMNKVQAALSQWQSLDSFDKTLGDATRAFDAKTFFRRSGLTSLREAWVGLQLARILNGSAIRINDETWPDIWIRLSDYDRGFEVVEIMEKGRKRGEENWEDGTVEEDPHEDWVKRAEQIPSQLKEAIHKKCLKGYPPIAALLVYLNINEWGIAQRKIEAAMHDSTSEAREKFTQVWVFWKERFYLLWDNEVKSAVILTSEYWKEGFANE